jgi:hypothetical protein
MAARGPSAAGRAQEADRCAYQPTAFSTQQHRLHVGIALPVLNREAASDLCVYASDGADTWALTHAFRAEHDGQGGVVSAGGRSEIDRRTKNGIALHSVLLAGRIMEIGAMTL